MGRLALEVLQGGTLVQRIELVPGELTIGRGAGNGVALDDPRVSRQHAKLAVSGEAVRLVDLGTPTGSAVNGRRVQGSADLSPGDEVAIGPFVLRVATGGGAAVRTSPPAPKAREPAAAADVAEFRHLVQELLRLSGLVGVTDLHAVLETLLARVMSLVVASNGFVVLARGGELTPVLRTKGASPDADAGYSRTVCLRAVTTRQTVLLSGPEAEAQMQAIESLAVQRPRLVIAIPLVDGDEVLGVLYMEGDRILPAALRDDLKLLSEISVVGGRALRVALDREQLISANERWRFLAQPSAEPDLEASSQSPAMRKVLSIVKRLAQEDITALILGESGTGKEVIARAIHRLSPRRDGPLVAVNCGAIPRELIEGELFGHEKGAFTGAGQRQPGRFELAQGGTLLLDEIGDLPFELQVKLLRVLEERAYERLGGRGPVPWDGRVLAATNHDLHALVAQGKFRADLLYRLDVVSIRLPPLRERLEDLPALVSDLLREANRKFRRKLYGVTPEALAAMAAYAWPGNIRELRNVIERAFVIEPGDALSREGLPFREADAKAARPCATGLSPDRPIPTIAEFVAAQEREYIRFVVDRMGTLTRAAEAMGITRSALYKKMRSLGMREPEGE